ncbi:hypothetical protein cypCar_00049572, partial [Cyprinus carpio]
AAGRWGSVHPPHYSGQLSGAQAPWADTRWRQLYAIQGRHGCSLLGRASRRSSSGYCWRLWRIPASPRCHGLRVCTETAGGAPTTTSCYLTELPESDPCPVFKKRHKPCLLLQDSYSYVRSTAPAVAYDSKQYYQQPVVTPAVAAAAAQPQPTVAESYYQTAAKTGYSQGATPYTQTQQTRQVTAIKPATPRPATSTFSIYPVSSAVQPVGAAAGASVVPSYSQSPTYSTNAVTYS